MAVWFEEGLSQLSTGPVGRLVSVAGKAEQGKPPLPRSPRG